MDNPGSRVYENGEIISTDSDTLRNVILNSMSLLGLENHYPEFEIQDPGDEYRMATGRRALYSSGKDIFQFSPEEHEGIVFHEACHYTMQHMGLSFSGMEQPTGFYDSVLDETMAELCTGFVHGYKPIKPVGKGSVSMDLWAFASILGAVRIRDGEIHPFGIKAEEGREDGVYFDKKFPVAKKLYAVNTMYQTQRRIEKVFLRKGMIGPVTTGIMKMLDYWPAPEHAPIRCDKFAQGAMNLAIENSFNLNMNEVRPRQLKDVYERGVDAGKGAQSIYYEDVLPLMQRESVDL